MEYRRDNQRLIRIYTAKKEPHRFLVLCLRSISLCPGDNMLCFPAAADAFRAFADLMAEGDAARADTRFLLDLILAGFVAAPGGKNESVTLFGKRGDDLTLIIPKNILIGRPEHPI